MDKKWSQLGLQSRLDKFFIESQQQEENISPKLPKSLSNKVPSKALHSVPGLGPLWLMLSTSLNRKVE